MFVSVFKYGNLLWLYSYLWSNIPYYLYIVFSFRKWFDTQKHVLIWVIFLYWDKILTNTSKFMIQDFHRSHVTPILKISNGFLSNTEVSIYYFCLYTRHWTTMPQITCLIFSKYIHLPDLYVHRTCFFWMFLRLELLTIQQTSIWLRRRLTLELSTFDFVSKTFQIRLCF
jgi:hypothetical protein